jgi:hypothetical protein
MDIIKSVKNRTFVVKDGFNLFMFKYITFKTIVSFQDRTGKDTTMNRKHSLQWNCKHLRQLFLLTAKVFLLRYSCYLPIRILFLNIEV